MNHIDLVDYSPEKAGVGGSTPSLATVSSKLLAVMTTWQFMVCLFGIQYWP